MMGALPTHSSVPLTERLSKVKLGVALRALGLISLGLYSHYWLLRNVSGFQSPASALACMVCTRSLLAHPYLHINVFQVRPPPPWALGTTGYLDHAPHWTDGERGPEMDEAEPLLASTRPCPSGSEGGRRAHGSPGVG